jgi:hypothetical protein
MSAFIAVVAVIALTFLGGDISSLLSQTDRQRSVDRRQVPSQRQSPPGI